MRPVTWVGFKTVWKREFIGSLQFAHVILGGLVNPVLMFAVFGYYLGPNIPRLSGIPYPHFLLAGVVSMQSVFTTYHQSAFSTYYSRHLRVTMDELLSSPIRELDIILGHAANSTLVGTVTSSVLLAILGLWQGVIPSLSAYLLAVGLLAANAFTFSLLGMAAGLVARNEYYLITISNVIITPLAFLADTFFPLSNYGGMTGRIIAVTPLSLVAGGIRGAFYEAGVPSSSAAILLLYALAALWGTWLVFRTHQQ